MNDFEIKLDRLADGELSHTEYSALLTSLDHQEEGWKKCALALLEAQALRTELRGVAQEPLPVAQTTEDAAASVETGSSHRQTWFARSRWGQAIAVAACLGMTFLLGRGSVAPQVTTPDHRQVAIQENPPRETPVAQAHQGSVTLVVNDVDGRPREMQVPVVDGNYVDARAVLSRSAAIPADVLEAIAHSGHKIESHREFVRQAVDDEHEVVVPLDRLRVVPVSNPMY